MGLDRVVLLNSAHVCTALGLQVGFVVSKIIQVYPRVADLNNFMQVCQGLMLVHLGHTQFFNEEFFYFL